MSARDDLTFRQIIRKAIPLQKAHIHDDAIGANTDFLTSDITPTPVGPSSVVPPVLFRIMVQLDTAAVFSAMVSDGTTEMTLEFNSGAQLAAGVLYMFDMLVDDDDAVNFQADQNVNVDKFIVHEVLWAVQ